jgi:hypothetical protein
MHTEKKTTMLLTPPPLYATIVLDSIDDTPLERWDYTVDRVRYTIYMNPTLKKKINIAANMAGKSVSVLIEELVETLVNSIKGMPSDADLDGAEKAVLEAYGVKNEKELES